MRPFSSLFLLALSASLGSATICPKTYYTDCSPKETSCPLGVDPTTGCDAGNVCQLKQGFNCPDPLCPCPLNQLDCPMPPKMGDGPSPCEEKMCADRYPVAGNPYYEQRGYECQGLCPSFCEWNNMTTCAPDFDSQGCPLQEICVPWDEECPQPLNDPRGCPIYNEIVDCGLHNMQVCSFEDFRGCTTQQFCFPDHIPCQASVFSGGCPIYEPVMCGENELTCSGASSYDEGSCPMSDYCVPSTLPTTNECLGICNTCGHNQQYCYGPMDNTCGIMPGECKDMEDNEGCRVFCDLDCPEGYYECQGDYDQEGCRMDPICVSNEEPSCPENTRDPQGCELPPKDPLAYDPEYETVCYDFDYARGCPITPYVVPGGNACPGVCNDQTACYYDPNMYACDQQYDFNTGCTLAPECVPHTYGYDGTPCDPNCSRLCDVGQMDCPATMDNNGCPIPNQCVPEFDGNGCPAVCKQQQCSNDQLECITYDPTGTCPETYSCWEQIEPSYKPDQVCPGQCPLQCFNDQVLCPETIDYNGCRVQECQQNIEDCPISQYDYNGCEIYPEQECQPDEYLCPKGADQYGCEYPHYCEHLSQPCYPICDYSSEIQCPGRQEMHPGNGQYDNRPSMDYCIPAEYVNQKGRLCQNQCEQDCGYGSHARIEYYHDGCAYQNCVADEGQCYEEDRIDEWGCYMSQYELEGVECQGWQHVCSGYYDDNGCPVADFCADPCQGCPEPEFDHMGCPVVQDPECQDSEFMCHMGHDQYTGCDLGYDCHPAPQGQCNSLCPLICDLNNEKLCGEIMYDENNCPYNYHQQCVPKNDFCPNFIFAG